MSARSPFAWGVAVASLAMITIVATGRQAHAEQAERAPARSGKIDLALLARADRGVFVGLPVTRAGVALDLRAREHPVAGSVTLQGGRTDAGLGAHRLELAVDLRARPSVFSLRVGPHLGYAMLVRTTGTDRFARALLGDIGTFAAGGHASIDLELPLGANVSIAIGGRAMAEVYDGGWGWALGPQAGVAF